ncbi:uncharacterized protein LOC122187546 isoform X2 [Lagopus leucura]|uniref:uncharacterized protein LOC122187546 isoform X2 n=1 Tax=Lagopus leucura TaxID=30410 RepID=UPI001C674BE4|nr:uncharacterized protein LOC122187546 isoform X2 [Lagopus leucura]
MAAHRQLLPAQGNVCSEQSIPELVPHRPTNPPTQRLPELNLAFDGPSCLCSVSGLLLSVLALHFCTQGPLAIAGRKVVNVSITATNHASVAATKASVATKQTLVAAANTSVVVTNQALVATKQSSLATTSASMAASNQALVATKQISMATSNQALLATKQTSMSATSMAASNHTSVTTTTTLVAISQASVAANSSMNLTEQTLLSCQSFQCFGERCYQDEAHRNTTATCHNETLCELYRFSSTNYTARCSSVCRAEPCRTNGSMALQQCTVECCNTSLCLQLNASSYGDLPPTTVPPTTTITTTTIPRPPPTKRRYPM